MNVVFVEVVQQLQEVLQGQLRRPLLSVLKVLQYLDHLVLEFLALLIGVLLLHLLPLLLLLHLLLLVLHSNPSQHLNDSPLVLVLTVPLRLLLQQRLHLLVLEGGLQGLVLTNEADPQQSVPLQEIDIGQRILGFYPDDTALHLRGRLEVVLAHLDQVVHLCQQLHVHAQPAVEVRPGLGDESLGELLLEHEYCAAEHGFLCEQFEDEGGADLVGDVCYADIEEGQLHLEYIARNEHELIGVLRVLEPLRQLRHHAGVDLNGDHLLRPLQQQRSQVTRTRTDLQHHVGRPDRRLDHHLVEDVRVDQDVLSVGLVEHHTRPVHRLLLLYHVVDILLPSLHTISRSYPRASRGRRTCGR